MTADDLTLLRSLLGAKPGDPGAAAGNALADVLDSPTATAALFELDSALASIGLSAPPAPTEPSARVRLLAALAKTSRFGRFAETAARLLGISQTLAQQLLDGIDQRTAWSPSPWPGISLYHLDEPLADYRIPAEAIIGFVRVPPGVDFPEHGHIGAEDVFIVQGALIDVSGSTSRNGDVVTMPGGTEHSFTAAPGPDLVYLAIIRDGVRFGELTMTPGHSAL